jgi:hypothetical protein
VQAFDLVQGIDPVAMLVAQRLRKAIAALPHAQGGGANAGLTLDFSNGQYFRTGRIFSCAHVC